MAGLLGFGGGTLVEGLLGQQQLDLPLTVALYAFAFSIPALILGLLTPNWAREEPRLQRAFETAGVFVAIAGVVALFFHFSSVASLAFAISSFAAVLIFIQSRKRPVKKG
ncbi:MAG: hypothetical protein Kow00124_30770 [Anaerolineae bacterium]